MPLQLADTSLGGATKPSVVRYKGDYWSFIFALKNPTTETPIDLTEYEPGGELVYGETVYPLSIDNGRAMFLGAPTLGKFALGLEAEVNNTFTANNAIRLRVHLIDAEGHRKTLKIIPVQMRA